MILLAAGWVGWRGYQAYRHLNSAAAEVSSLQVQIANLDDIDLPRAQASVAKLQDDARAAVDATSDPLYRAAGHLPWLGANLRAVGTIAGTVDQLATGPAAALIDVARTAQPSALAPKNGAIDVAPIAAAAASLQQADLEVRAALQRTAEMDRSDLIGPVARAMNTLQNKLTALSGSTGTAAGIARLAPPLLGQNGTRRYLVVFQNLAEPRATGGIFGSYAVMVVDHGKLTITDQGASSRDIGTFEPPLPLPENLSPVLYGDLPGTYPTDVNLTPDFPTAASLFAQMYEARHHQAVDGVLSVDPVALSYLLQGVAPVGIGHGLALTSSTITSILLSKAYELYPATKDALARDEFLDNATAKAFSAITQSPKNPTQLIHGLSRAAAEHRVLLWSAHATEQQDLAQTILATALPASAPASPSVGVFRNDATGAKLGYYAAGSAVLTPGACLDESMRRASLQATFRYTAPKAGLSAYVLGLATAGPYVLRTNVMVFGPLHGDLSDIKVDGVGVPVAWASESGRKVGLITIDQKPGTDTVVTAQLTLDASSAIAGQFKPRLVVTPGVKPWKVTTGAYSSCGPTG